MKILFLLCPIFIFAFDFIFEENFVYKLNESEFSINNGIIEVKINKLNNKLIQNIYKGLQAQSFKIVFDNNLAYYYHTNRYHNYIEELVELKKKDMSYVANSYYSDFKNCFLVLKRAEQKNMKTKSSAILLDIDSLDSTSNNRIYINCIKNKNYIF
ncbi:hypothetical protein [Helicobacter sp. MIT 14-3879]|uniref:hypothetical protein n=1 Tax=Helicobacter sp. MIT 14-3879 TaxID=2040649 RepID=UPI000E1EA999|nr:hypothetical protein [Helicobacter sp. MIT 14-3879]RDU64098.1 hypothetical protein CQA44_04010 [Helicobacter sp. MIT 14-3879]